MATVKSIRPKMVIERVPWHGIMPPRVDFDPTDPTVYGFRCQDSCFHKTVLQMEYILDTNGEGTPEEIEEDIDWTDVFNNFDGVGGIAWSNSDIRD